MRCFFNKSILYLIFTASILSSCYKEELIFSPDPSDELTLPTIIKFNGRECVHSENQNSLRYTITEDSIASFSPYIEYNANVIIKFDSLVLSNKSINHLGSISLTRTHTITVITENETNKFTLEFTNLPIVQIITRNEIYDETKTLARLIIHHPDKSNFLDSFIGIETRGNSSQSFDKKSFGFSLLSDMNLNKTISSSLFNLK